MINVPIHDLTTRCPLILVDGVPEWSTRVPFPAQDRPGDKTYVTQAKDSLMTLAHRFYGDPKLWWVLWDNNRSVLTGHPMYLTPGTVLRVASKQAVDLELLHDNQQV